jgi:hypothetical protein
VGFFGKRAVLGTGAALQPVAQDLVKIADKRIGHGVHAGNALKIRNGQAIAYFSACVRSAITVSQIAVAAHRSAR